MLLEKGHKLELLVDLAAANIVDRQSFLLLRPRSNEGTRRFVRYVLREAARNTGLHRCLFLEVHRPLLFRILSVGLIEVFGVNPLSVRPAVETTDKIRVGFFREFRGKVADRAHRNQPKFGNNLR